MSATMTAFEVTGRIDEQQQLLLDTALPMIGPRRVRIIVLAPHEDEIDEDAWLSAAAASPSFAFLRESAENIYTVEDGKPYHDEA